MIKSSYEVEIIINGKPLKEYLYRGQIYIEGKKGSVFSLKLRNNTSERKLFVPSVDGLSVIDGKNASCNSGGYIINPYNSIKIKGWRVSNEEVAEFYFSDPEKSYAIRIDKSQNLGVIGCLVFSEKKKFQIPYYHEYQLNNSTGNTGISFENTYNCIAKNGNTYNLSCNSSSCMSAKLGSGWGDYIKDEITTVFFDREENFTEKFEIFYNTREELEKIGINFRKESLYVSFPQAFPAGFCKPPKK